MTIPATALGLLVALASAAPAQAAAQDAAAAIQRFPASSAMAEGVSPRALAGLGELVQGLVDDDEVVGAELLVIKNGKTLLHEAYGFADREAGEAMELGSVFCVRSMTKPVIGAAVLMLVDDNVLELDDTVASFLPAFDVDGKREITVEQLLTHTSGLPMSEIMARDPATLASIQEVAALGGEARLDFAPGSAFQYSDQGTDTLTALIEVVADEPAADFVRRRVLDPLGMQNTTCLMTEGHSLRDRALPKYAGAPGNWSAFWRPDGPPLFPIFLGSQGLYSTLEDYARFMQFWKDKGRVGMERLLASRYVRKALTPGPQALGGSTGLPGLHVEYGYLMQLWMGAEEGGEGELVAFGHTGSDGTHAWVFPEQKAMALYFTQSRGTSSGALVEQALGELFLGVPYDATQDAPPFDEYLGYYVEDEHDELYRAIIRDGDDMALEVVGRGIVPLAYLGEDRWRMRPDPSKVLAFERSETGQVISFSIGAHRELRFEPSADLPDPDQLAERVARAHRMDLIESLGPIRIHSTLEIPKISITGEEIALLAWPDRFRYDSSAGEQTERLACDGEHVRYGSSMTPVELLEGEQAELMRTAHPLARFGDWRRWYPELRVIQRVEGESGPVYVVRTGDTSAPARTLHVEWESGRVVREASLVQVKSMGRIGQRVRFSDFRDVSGMLLPFRAEAQLANPMIGGIVTQVTEVELGVELPEGTFELLD